MYNIISSNTNFNRSNIPTLIEAKKIALECYFKRNSAFTIIGILDHGSTECFKLGKSYV